jgi:hypothetical protein
MPSSQIHCACITKTSHLILFREITAVYCEKCTKHTNSLRVKCIFNSYPHGWLNRHSLLHVMSYFAHWGTIYYACALASNAAKLKFASVRTIISSNVMVLLTTAISVALWNYPRNAQRFWTHSPNCGKRLGFVMSACPSAWNNTASTVWIFFIKFVVWVFFENLPWKLKFH